MEKERLEEKQRKEKELKERKDPRKIKFVLSEFLDNKADLSEVLHQGPK